MNFRLPGVGDGDGVEQHRQVQTSGPLDQLPHRWLTDVEALAVRVELDTAGSVVADPLELGLRGATVVGWTEHIA